MIKNYEVVVLDNFCTGSLNNLIDSAKKVTVIYHYIREPLPAGIFKNCSVVFHLAALADIVPSIERTTDSISNNVQGTVNVLEDARLCHVERVI